MSIDNNISYDLQTGSSPHIKSHETTRRLMLDVIIALLPAMIGSVYFFRMAGLKVLLLSVISAIVTEALVQKLFKREVTIKDLSAVVTGILLAFNIPAGAPWYLPVLGSAFAIGIVKQCFGGLGNNFMNPALAGRAFLLASWPQAMTKFIAPVDAISGPTPLAILDSISGASPKAFQAGLERLPSLMDMFIGNIGGSLGETSALLLLIGGLYLIVRKVIDWKVPLLFILTTSLSLFIFGVEAELLIYHILSGGLILGAFFMATDYATTPASPIGRIIFAIGAGFLTGLIRTKGGMPEGVSYAILLMNTATPLIERYISPKVYGR